MRLVSLGLDRHVRRLLTLLGRRDHHSCVVLLADSQPLVLLLIHVIVIDPRRDERVVLATWQNRLVGEDGLASDLIFALEQPHICLWCQTELLAAGARHDIDLTD